MYRARARYAYATPASAALSFFASSAADDAGGSSRVAASGMKRGSSAVPASAVVSRRRAAPVVAPKRRRRSAHRFAGIRSPAHWANHPRYASQSEASAHSDARKTRTHSPKVEERVVRGEAGSGAGQFRRRRTLGARDDEGLARLLVPEEAARELLG